MPKEIKQILDTINYSWPKDYIIRYIYIKTAVFFKRDLSYFLASKEEQVEIYIKGFIDKGYDVVCSTLADFYINIFNSIGIKAKKIIAIDRKVPLFALMVEGEKGWYYLDPLKDLFNNQYGLKPTEFGILLSHRKNTLASYPELVSLDKEYLTEIDNQLGLAKNYLDTFFRLLHLEVTDKNKVEQYLGRSVSSEELLFEKMNFINHHLINFGNVNGLYERLQLHQFLRHQVYNTNEKEHISHRIVETYDGYKLNIGITIPSNDGLVIFEENKKEDRYILERIQ